MAVGVGGRDWEEWRVRGMKGVAMLTSTTLVPLGRDCVEVLLKTWFCS